MKKHEKILVDYINEQLQEMREKIAELRGINKGIAAVLGLKI